MTCCAASSESARKPSDERSASGSSRCQTSSVEVDRSARRTRARARGGRSRRARRRAARRRARCRRLPRRSRRRTSSPARSCAAPSARRSGSSRVPPLSIAPSGTSLISRSRTDSSSTVEQRFAPSSTAQSAIGRRLRIRPVRARRDAAARRSTSSDGRACSFEHAGKRRQRAGNEAERQVRVDRLVVELGADEPAREQALQLGREDEQVADDRVVQRLDAEPVARDHRAPLAARPRPRSPNLPRSCSANAVAVRPRRDAGGSPCRSGVRKRCPSRSQAVAQLVVVVELAVLDRPDRAVLVRERLVAALDVDDAQPARRRARPRRRHVRAAVVRAAVRHRVGHPIEHLRRARRRGVLPAAGRLRRFRHTLPHASRRPSGASTPVRPDRVRSPTSPSASDGNPAFRQCLGS